jgi:exopolyphosphatase/guanosine-5'-triphosphate,3'-diphosphate pyrophosphatase
VRVAAIDIGTNSVLLLVAEQRGAELVPVEERATVTRLGQGVDRTRALAPEAIERTLACLRDYAAVLRGARAERLDVVGTSAMRDAQGGAAFVERARDLLGVAPRVVSGEEEAALSFEGALAGLELGDGAVTVFDVGGGSTEIIRGHASGSVRDAISLQVGSVRLTERHLASDPPSAAELARVREDVRAALATAPGAPTGTLVGVAGTVTTIAAVANGVAPYDGSRVHGARVDAATLGRTLERLAGAPLALRRQISGLDPARADVVVAGTVLVQELLAWAFPGAGGAPSADASFVASDRGVRWGLARRLAGR